MVPAPSGTPRLQVLQAVDDGWRAFCRAPVPFVLFTLVAGALALAFQALSNLASLPEASQPPLALALVGSLVGSIGYILVNLWGITGLIRGAWTALEGGRPTWATFSRWDGGAAARLFVRQLAFGVLLLGLGVAAALLAFGFSAVQPWLAAIPVVVVLLLVVYLSVGQTFLPWLALLGGQGPLETLQRGRTTVDPQWWQVLLLALVQSVIVLIGLLLCGVGLLAAAPVAICVSTAAYRQLFGADDRAGLLS